MNQLTKAAIEHLEEQEKDSKVTTMLIYTLLGLGVFGFIGVLANHLAK